MSRSGSLVRRGGAETTRGVTANRCRAYGERTQVVSESVRNLNNFYSSIVLESSVKVSGGGDHFKSETTYQYECGMGTYLLPLVASMSIRMYEYINLSVLGRKYIRRNMLLT